jgi:hypothetical protein
MNQFEHMGHFDLQVLMNAVVFYKAHIENKPSTPAISAELRSAKAMISDANKQIKEIQKEWGEKSR